MFTYRLLHYIILRSIHGESGESEKTFMIQFVDIQNARKAKTCAVTGMRPHKLPFREGDEQHSRLMEAMENAIRDAIADGYTEFLSGGAMGPDLWFAETVHRLKCEYPHIRLMYILPCETQANRWTEAWRDRYFNLLAASDDVICVSHPYTPTCMHERNRALVDRSSLLFAVHDGLSAGGTKYTVEYAQKQGVPVRLMWSSNLATPK